MAHTSSHWLAQTSPTDSRQPERIQQKEGEVADFVEVKGFYTVQAGSSVTRQYGSIEDALYDPESVVVIQETNSQSESTDLIVQAGRSIAVFRVRKEKSNVPFD